MRILLIGDIIGKKGREIVDAVLSKFKQEEKIDFCIANGENLAGGFGITSAVAKQSYAAGVDVLTGGNHIWSKKEIYQIIDTDEKILRPLNYPPGVPGCGGRIYTVNNQRIGVISLCGRVFMDNLDCPFRTVMLEIERMRTETQNIIVDFHAEATSEKIAMGLYLDGLVSAVIGTHTHVQTADERILPKGTAYITDTGMVGAKNSAIGVDSAVIIKRFLTSMPLRFDVTKTGPGIFCGVIIEISLDTDSRGTTANALSIKRVQREIG
ncbi:TIGR00282 family metallophosphoesterase [Candidatus Desantisbacteria bacterium]|nr:TIGR00282 family metallophosphoesterase [Candidatus Desantisbacteria bacterium]